MVLTADRSGLSGRMSTVFDDKMIMRMADTNDFT